MFFKTTKVLLYFISYSTRTNSWDVLLQLMNENVDKRWNTINTPIHDWGVLTQVKNDDKEF